MDNLCHAEEVLVEYVRKYGEIDPEYYHLLPDLMDRGIIVWNTIYGRYEVLDG